MQRAAILCGLAASPTAAAESEREAIHVRWSAWKAQFGKSYASWADEEVHAATFSANLKIIEIVNQQHLSYRLSENFFADLSLEEVSLAMLGRRRSGTAAPSLGPHLVSVDEVLPASVDWRAKGAVNAPQFQGVCGSCWSFSATGSLEGAYQVATGRLLDLSEQQLVSCAGEAYGCHGCGGGDEDKSALYARDFGLCAEQEYPYLAEASGCDDARVAGCTAGLPKGAIVGFSYVPGESEEALLSAVAQRPVATGVKSASPGFLLYSGGVLSGDHGTKIDHAVLTVGYGTDPEGGDYWLVKNSFGTHWGENGYIRIQRTASGKGVCGIMQDTSYPVVQSRVVV